MGERPTRAPHTQARSAPPRCPRPAPKAGKASTQKQARQEDEGIGPTPQELNRQSTGPQQKTRRGTNRLERPYRRPAPELRQTDPEGGGGAYAAGARAHTTDTRRGPEDQPDGACGTHRPHGMAYRQAKGRDTHAGQPETRTARNARAGRSPRGDARTGTYPDLPPQMRAPHTHDQGAAPAKAVVAHSARHQRPRLGSLRASPWGSHRKQASSTGPAAPASRATTHQGGGVVGKRLQPRLLSDALTGEWRKGEAGEGQGSEPREPGGLHHQAGGVS